MGLEAYRKKRDFSRTAEPQGRQKRRKGYSFVVQKHDARNLHYDFRLELGGVLLSWAVPKGPSLDPAVKRLAMQTEDHPVDYGDFEGVIPAGDYGGGTVLLWDQGTWQPEGDAEEMYRRGRLSFELKGKKLEGGFHLVRTAAKSNGSKKDGRQWLLFKSKDATARPGSDARILEERPESVASGRELEAIAKDPDHVWTSKVVKQSRRAVRAAAPAPRVADQPGVHRARLPRFVEPQLATLAAEAPEGDDWLHEIKLDGYRILARIENGRAQLQSRRGNDWTARLPTIASALGALPVGKALLDGEVVVLGENGVSDFQTLQNSLEADRDARCTYFAFDAPFLDGHDLRQLPLSERKRLLQPLLSSDNPRVRFSEHIQGGGRAFFERACGLGLEGIVCKRADAPYVSGRTRSWLKVKCLSQQEFVIGGFTAPSGSRRHLGALLLGVRDGKALVYAGKVGTGFTQASLAELMQRLRPLEQSEPPFSQPPRGADARGVHWVAPRLVAQVAFTERTQSGAIRHASFQGLRDDKPAKDVRIEQPSTARRASSQQPRAVPKAKENALPKPRKRSPAAADARGEPVQLDLSKLEITHPDRVLYPDQGITKRDLMLHYARVARWMLPHVLNRPLMLLRCPEGEGQQCFHQKHPSAGMPKAVQRVMVQQKKGPEPHLVVQDLEGVLGLVQMGALEIHTWGCRADALDRPDQLVFDLDPDVGLPWASVLKAAQAVKQRVERAGLTGFAKATGGKGVHVVVPVRPAATWDETKRFCKGIADELVRSAPAQYVATMTKQQRKGKLFIDYFRNGSGATAVCVFSTRARPGAPVAVPISWQELEAAERPVQFTLATLEQRLRTLRSDPWAGFDEARAALP